MLLMYPAYVCLACDENALLVHVLVVGIHLTLLSRVATHAVSSQD